MPNQWTQNPGGVSFARRSNAEEQGLPKADSLPQSDWVQNTTVRTFAARETGLAYKLPLQKHLFNRKVYAPVVATGGTATNAKINLNFWLAGNLILTLPVDLKSTAVETVQAWKVAPDAFTVGSSRAGDDIVWFNSSARYFVAPIYVYIAADEISLEIVSNTFANLAIDSGLAVLSDNKP